jgi:hypothetical protein
MQRILLWSAVLALLAPAAAWSQPTLDSLWPNDDGLRWTYSGNYEDIVDGPESFTGILQFDGTVPLFGGGTGQNLEATAIGVPASSASAAGAARLQGFWRQLWIARPDLRAKIESYAAAHKVPIAWPLLLLGPANFVKDATTIGSWSEVEDYWGWWYLTNDLTMGAQWTLQLVRPLADDVFLHATVTSLMASVVTDAGTFNDAVQMDYLVEYGLAEIIDEGGNSIGTVRAETSGTVYYVPNVGPVACEEHFYATEVNCPTCPPDEWPVGVDLAHGDLSLRSLPVAEQESSWGHVKALFAGE